MRKLSIQVRLVAVLLGVFVMAIAIQTYGYVRGNDDLLRLQARSVQLLKLQDLAHGLNYAVTDQYGGVRDYILTGSPAALLDYQAARAREAELFGAAASISAAFPEIAGEVLAIADATNSWRLRYLEPTVALVQAGQLAEARAPANLAAGAAIHHTTEVTVDALDEHVAALNRSNLAAIGNLISDRSSVFMVGIAVALAGAVAAAALLSHWVARPLARQLAAARRVEAGEDVPFPSESDDEIGRLGSALERMRIGLYGQAGEASVVNRFTELIAFVEADGDVARATLDALEELVHPDGGTIHISNRSKDRAIPEGSIGTVTPEIVALGQLSSCPGVRRSGLYVTRDLSDRLSVRCSIYPAMAGTLACIPLLALGEVVGAVHLHWATPDGLPLGVRAVVSRITEHASLSVANRRLLVALKGMASTDARTGLANSRTFDQTLEDALAARGAGAEEPLSVLMLDVDNFKAFNDRNGHPAGDEALRSFAGVLRSAVRGHDLPARYGGEEFAVLLPGVDAQTAAVVAERIRALTETTTIALSPGHSDRITVSIGIASVPADGVVRVELLRVADAALYRAKQAGRNRVVVASAVFADRQAEVMAEPTDTSPPASTPTELAEPVSSSARTLGSTDTATDIATDVSADDSGRRRPRQIEAA